MNSEKLVYVMYIATTPEKVWSALIQGELTRQYWKHENVSDWKVGSRWEHIADDGKRTLRLVGEVLESVPSKRLVITWGEPSETDKRKHSRVAIDIEAVGEDMVRLTVTHDELEPGSEMLRKVSNGWPRVLSSMKSFLETGRPLVTWA
jgi:uncharacterized protein YndB with AHSA1/START domain